MTPQPDQNIYWLDIAVEMSIQWGELRTISGCPEGYCLKEWLCKQRRRLENSDIDWASTEPRRTLAVAKEYLLEIHEALGARFDETTLEAARRAMTERKA